MKKSGNGARKCGHMISCNPEPDSPPSTHTVQNGEAGRCPPDVVCPPKYRITSQVSPHEVPSVNRDGCKLSLIAMLKKPSGYPRTFPTTSNTAVSITYSTHHFCCATICRSRSEIYGTSPGLECFRLFSSLFLALSISMRLISAAFLIGLGT